MSVVKSLSKPVLEVLERESVSRGTTVNLKVTFNVTFDNPSGILPEGRDVFHRLYGIRVEVNGYKDPDHQIRDNHTHLFNFKRLVRRWVPGGGIFSGSPFGGRFQEVSTRDFLLSGNVTEPISDEPHIRINDFRTEITYRNQTAISQEVSFDLLDVNKRRNDLPWKTPAELDLLFVRLFVIDLSTGHVVKETRSNNFQGLFEIGAYERSSI